jgi:dTDP-4-amino-4,6-dideoxygalactose transaminase
MIPLVDLGAQYSRLRSELLAAIEDVFSSGAFIHGKRVTEFETTFAKLHGASHAIGCSNGTSAIFLALAALGIAPGDEVITTTHSFIATAEAICHAGATPVFVDIDPQTYAIDAAEIRKAITHRTKAILPVHIYGNPCAMDQIVEIANETGLKVIEDCAQAHLAKFQGRCVGTFGDAATFSFYPAKNLGAYGDAGMVFMSTAEKALLVKKLLDHGRVGKYEHDIIGYNHRMDELQAALLSVKLKYLPEWNRIRRERVDLYNQLLGERGFQAMKPTPSAEPAYHLYVVQTSNRKEVMNELTANEIAFGVHYPIPLHLQASMTHLGYKQGSFPVAERLSQRIISLPLYAELSEDSVRKIVSVFSRIAKP